MTLRTATLHIGPLDPGAGGYPLTFAADGEEATGTLPADLGAAGAGDPIAHYCDAVLTGTELVERGNALFDALFAGDVHALWSRLGDPFRIILDIEPPALRRVPWELMHEVGERVVTRPDRLISRRAKRRIADRPPAPSWPLRVLVVIGAADIAAEIGPELDALVEAFSKICGLIDLEVVWLQSQDAVRSKLAELKPHILHVVAHGEEDGHGSLVLHDETTGNDWTWAAADLRSDLPLLSPRLVVLNACRSADGAPSPAHQDVVRGFAEAFIDAGVAAVVAMQGNLSGSAGAAFSRNFYTALIQDHDVDVALVEGRMGIRAQGASQPQDWSLPTLVSAVSPQHILHACAHLDPVVHGQVASDISFFIDRAEQRREVWQKLGLGQELEREEADALVVAGEDSIGKSSLVRWCIGAAELHGRNVAHVDLRSRRKLPSLQILGMIAQGLARNHVNADHNKAVFDDWIADVDRLLGTAPRPGLDRYHRVLPPKPPQNALPDVFESFCAALSRAAGGQPLIVALDHIDSTAIHKDVWSWELVPYLLEPIVARRLQPVRIILVVQEKDPAHWIHQALSGAVSLPLGGLPGARRRELLRTYLLYEGHPLTAVDRLLELVSDAPKDWPPSELKSYHDVACSMRGAA